MGKGSISSTVVMGKNRLKSRTAADPLRDNGGTVWLKRSGFGAQIQLAFGLDRSGFITLEYYSALIDWQKS